MKYFLASIFALIFFTIPFPLHAQTEISQSIEYTKGEVVNVIKSGKTDTGIIHTNFQDVQVKIISGADKDKTVTIRYSGLSSLTGPEILSPGDIVVIQKTLKGNTPTYGIHDKYRLDAVTWILLSFFAFIILMAGKRGMGSIIGMLFSLGVILFFIVPQILQGHDPLLISIIGAFLIMLISIYLAHGLSQQTTIAVASTALTLSITALLSYLFVSLTELTGLGSEEFAVLQLGNNELNIQGLLLGGIIIGVLGVLDDITTAQTAAVFELHSTNPSLTVKELIKRGYRIGREHITSLVNTLVLAYAGTSIAIFILLVINPAQQPYWVILNSQEIIEEIVRALSGSVGLVLAVPITTTLAAWHVGRKNK